MRVPEPFSRKMNRSPCNCASVTRFLAASRWPAAAMTTSGLGMRIWSSSGKSPGGMDIT
jgi:hypothetical protein